jgi:adenosine deaminase
MNEHVDADLLSLCRAHPKVDLHAHLSGSIPDSLLVEFLKEDVAAGKMSATAFPEQLTLLSRSDARSLPQCFEVFHIIHKLVNSAERVRSAVDAVLSAFEKENCVYLELRTTPRTCGSMSAMEYISVVLGAIHDWSGQIVCRLLLSIDRARPLSEARSALDIARVLLCLPTAHKFHGLVVGLDLSGDPTKSSFSAFKPLLLQARTEFGDKLPISLHFAEVENAEEALQMLRFRPERLGHALCLTQEGLKELIASKICVEVCLTSNSLTRSMVGMPSNPVVRFSEERHPFCICTDDAGVFRTSLTREHALLKKAVSAVCLHEVTATAIARSFATDGIKAELLSALRDCAGSQN